jgi:sugar/nucleoside kinase (ribokinase family)
VRKGIICGGCILIDVNKVVDRFPPQEHVAMIESETPDTGGPGLNIAINLSRLGARFPIEVVGLVGNDPHGHLLLETCRDAGIGVGRIGVLDGISTSYTDVMIVRDTGRRTFFHHVGANALLSPGHFDFTDTTAKLFHIGSPGLHEAMDRVTDAGSGFVQVLRKARDAGLRTNMELVSLPPERLREQAVPCLPYLDSIIINEVEASALTGIDAVPSGEVDWSRVEQAASALLRLGVAQIAVIHFPQGCVAATSDGKIWRQSSVRVPQQDVRSANGAGDALAAGVMLGLHEDWPVQECVKLGVCAAATSLRSFSTSRGIPSAAECLAYGERHGLLNCDPAADTRRSA